MYGDEATPKHEMMESQPMETPKYLYKILSLRSWQASQHSKRLTLPIEDDAFVHLSRDDQLERIILKYWPNATQYVILKIDTAKLQGKLVFEANPGGTSRYYHLYDGHIPFSSIVESKIIDCMAP